MRINKTFLYFISAMTLVTILSACCLKQPQAVSVIGTSEQPQTASSPDAKEPKEQPQVVENWQKVGENLYFDTNSLEINGDTAGGNFKEYFISQKAEKYPDAHYQIISTAAYCDIEIQDGIRKLEFPIYKYYDKNDKFLGENNIHEYWHKNYPDGHLGITWAEDEINGNIYFDTLCKKYEY